MLCEYLNKQFAVNFYIAKYLLIQVLASSIIRAMMEAASTCEMSVNFYQTK
jgi:hypothetical protein